MADPKVTTHLRPNSAAKNGYTGAGHTQQFAGEEAQATLLQTADKGGMRGLGLLAVVIAEIALKKESIDLAKDYYNTNKQDYDFFRSTHQGPIADSVSEVMSPTLNPVFEYDYYASAPAGIAKSSILDRQWFETRRRTHRYATGLQRKVDYDFALLRTHGVVAGWNLGRRYELAWADAHNNLRFDKMAQMGNIGVGVGNVVREGLSSSVAGLASAYDNLGDTVATIGNGLASNSGYQAGRKDTAERYNQRTPNQLASSTSSMRRNNG